MFTRSLVTVVVIANAILGSFCMMPMAMASSIPVQQDESMEMNMTSMYPMSPAHCEHCLHVDQRNNAPTANGCAGHCLAKANEALTAAISVSSANQIVLALPTAFSTVAEPAYVPEKYSTSTAPPINLASTRGVVMIN